MEGKGEYSWGDGNHYVGMFKNGKQNGVGVYEWPTGGKYIGHWRDDKMHGFGTYKRDDGVVYFGMWEDDHQSGMGLKVVPARFCYGENKKSYTKRKFREIWKDKVLIYQKEIIEMPSLWNVQQRKCLIDIHIVCQRRGLCDEEEDHYTQFSSSLITTTTNSTTMNSTTTLNSRYHHPWSNTSLLNQNGISSFQNGTILLPSLSSSMRVSSSSFMIPQQQQQPFNPIMIQSSPSSTAASSLNQFSSSIPLPQTFNFSGKRKHLLEERMDTRSDDEEQDEETQHVDDEDRMINSPKLVKYNHHTTLDATTSNHR